MNSDLNFSKHNKIFFLSLAIFLISLTCISFPYALAVTPNWDFPAYSLNAGGVEGGGFPTLPIKLTVEDLAASGSGSIQVHITSSVDPVGFDLTLNEGPIGTFKNTNLALMRENSIVTTSDTLTITIFDDRFPDPLKTQTLEFPPRIMSDSDPTGFSPIYTETGLDTNLFTTTINFDSITNPATNTLAVSPGDIFSVWDSLADNASHGFVEANPNVGKGAILAEVGGIVTATYQGDSSSIITTKNSGPGRGSGGLIAPGLVVDSSSGGSKESGGGCVNCTPPTLGVDSKFDRIVQKGFSFNDNAVDVEQYYTPYPLITANVGQENKIVLKIFDDGGTQNIEHVGLAFGLGKDQFFSESKATINLDRTLFGREKISTFDPENVLDDVKIVTSKESCNNFSNIPCLKVTIYQKFREELEFNMVSTNVWDSKKNAWQNFYNHGIEIIGDSLNPPKTKMIAFGEKNMRGLFELTEIDKKKHLWTDEFGNLYEDRGNDYFEKIFAVPSKTVFDKETMHGCDRQCNWFNYYKFHQELLAENTLDQILSGKIIENDSMKEAFSHSYKIISREENPVLQESIIFEKIKAEELSEKILNPEIYPEFYFK